MNQYFDLLKNNLKNIDCNIINICISNIIILLCLFITFINSINKRRKVDEKTLNLLTKKVEVPGEFINIITKMNEAKIETDEKKCVEQLRSILSSGALPYPTLSSNPELLLGMNRFIGETECYGALWTRFTVQYNLYAGSIVAMGSEEQKQKLYATQKTGDLGCFAFTECGAGVLSGAVLEATAVYDKVKKVFIIHSPNETSKKKWISQGMYAENAVISANLMIDDGNDGLKNGGPHLFFAKIQQRNRNGDLTPLKGVELESLPKKTVLLGLDNAFVMFDNFEVPHDALLSRFSSVDIDTGVYTLALPKGVTRMLDLLISRLLTGRVVLSEFTTFYSMVIIRRCWDFASNRTLWKGKKPVAQKVSDLPLMQSAFVDYTRSLQMIAHYIAITRGKICTCIRNDKFTYEAVEGACISKFVGTGFAVDVMSVMRKMMGSQALYDSSWLGESSFVGNATCAAEGDNTIMELKIVQDMFRGRTSLIPFGLFWRISGKSVGRKVIFAFLYRIMIAYWLKEKALDDGQLLREIGWCRAHLLIIDSWLNTSSDTCSSKESRPVDWLDSYEHILVRFPMPVQC
jgi:acyl-CoA oxidase